MCIERLQLVGVGIQRKHNAGETSLLLVTIHTLSRTDLLINSATSIAIRIATNATISDVT